MLLLILTSKSNHLFVQVYGFDIFDVAYVCVCGYIHEFKGRGTQNTQNKVQELIKMKTHNMKSYIFRLLQKNKYNCFK